MTILLIGIAALVVLFALKREDAAIFFLFVTLGLAASWYFPAKRIALLARWGFIAVMLFHYFKNREARRTDLIDRLFISFIILCFISVRYSINSRMTFLRSLLLLFMYWVVFREMFRFLSQKGGIATFRTMVAWYVKLVFLVTSLLFLSRHPGCYLYSRFRGFFENPNTLGLFGTIGLPVLFASFVEGRDKTVKKRINDGLFLVMGLACVLLSGSRTGLASALCGMLIYLLISPGRKKKYVFLTISVSVFIYIAGIKILPLLEPVMRTDSLSNLSGRTEAWEAAFDFINKRPFLGYGYGTEGMVFSFHGIKFLHHHGGYVHNSFIGIALMTGYLGVMIFCGILATTVVYCYRLFKVRDSLGEFRSTADLSIALVAAGLLSAFTESWIMAIGGVASMLFWVFVMVVFLLDCHFVRGQGIISQENSADTLPSRPDGSHTPEPGIK